MPIFRREDEAVPIVVASAATVRLFDEDPEELSSRAKRVGYALGWQFSAWKWYGTLGEVWYSHAWKGNAIGGLHWLIGVQAAATGDLIPGRGSDGRLAAGVDEELFGLAQDALDRLIGPNGSHGEWARPLGTAMSCVAEGWLVGYHIDDDGDPVDGMLRYPEPDTPDPGEENPAAVRIVWDACSPCELTKAPGEDGKQRLRIQRSSEGEPQLLPRDAVAVRIWRRHPRWSEDADGPMEPLIDVCEDLYLLRMAVRGSALSRTHAGLLLIPSEGLGQPLSAYANQVSGGGGEGQGPPPNPVVTELIAGLTTPHRDPASAASVVPTTMTTKGDRIEQWKHLPLTRTIDPQQSQQREELIRAYATGVDLPPERLLGMADLNHWTAWQVGEDSWRHVDPDARCISDGLTAGYLWPDMVAAWEEAHTDAEVTDELLERIRAFRVTYDPTAVIISPDRSEDADAALEAGAISWSAYRRYKHIPETDAPTIEELEQRALLGFGGKTANGTPAGPGDVQEGPAASTPPGQARAAVDALAIRQRQTVRASLRVTGAMEQYARTCARIETEFLRDVLIAVDSSVDEAVRKAQARLRSAAQRDPTYRAQIRGTRNAELTAILGQRATRALIATFAEGDDDSAAGIFDGALALLLARYADLASSASGEWRRITREMLEVEFDDDELALLDADIAASGPVLESGARQAAEAAFIGGAAAAVLLDPAGPGEIPSGVRIPPVVVRRAAARAGGAPVGGGVTPIPEGWAGGLTSGPTIDEFLGRRGFVPAGMVWNYGAISSRRSPYLPHVELGGIEVAALEDYMGFYPGDHAGCQCAIARLYTNPEGDTAEVESLDPSELP